MEIKHIYWFAYFNLQEPTVRYRAKFPLVELELKQGISYNIVYPGYDIKSLMNFLLTYFSVLFFRKKNSIIVFQKIYTNGIYAKALKLLLFFRPNYTLYDIDDAEHTRRPADTIHHFMRHCSACSVGSNALVDYAHQFNENVILLTSPVIEHGITKRALQKTWTIGWIGYYGAHRQSLKQLFFPALKGIDFPVVLKLLGAANEAEVEEIKAYFSDNLNVVVDAPLGLDWLNERSIYQIIATFDVGVSPLLDTEFNRAKSAFKLKQCLSCGIPVLGSSVGENKTFLQDGMNGYLCDTPSEYLQRLKQMSGLPESGYSAFSGNATAGVHQFSVSNYCLRLIDYFKSR